MNLRTKIADLSETASVSFDSDGDLLIARRSSHVIVLTSEEADALRDWLNNNSPSANKDTPE